MEMPDALRTFPKNTKDDLRRANDLFSHYLFFDKHAQVSTTCCARQSAKLLKTQTVPEPQRGEHASNQPNAQTVGHSAGTSRVVGHHRERATCPFCGKAAMWYAAHRGRKSLTAYRPCLFLHRRGGKVYGDAVWLKKTYENSLTPRIEFQSTFAYVFEQGKPRMWGQSWTGKWSELSFADWFGRTIASFTDNNQSQPFHVIGMERLAGTFLQYAPTDYSCARTGLYYGLPKLLLLCCIYPQLEMLHKMRLDFLIRDLMNGTKNAEVMDWSQTDPRKALQMDGGELKTLAQHRYCNADILRFRMRMQRYGHRVTVDEAAEIVRNCGNARAWLTLSKVVRESGIPPQKIVRYLDKHVCQCSHGGGFTRLCDVFCYWRDYIGFCKILGYRLKDRIVTLPPDLKAAHDRAASAAAAIKRERAAKQDRARQAEADRKYGFALGGFIIRAPSSAEEIIAEGKALSHCVGGFAERHMDAKLTILFLRRQSRPEKPLVTIEMNGNQLVQVHGYRNEHAACKDNPNRIPARELYAEILDPWLAWVRSGSKRDKKTGEPQLPARKEQKTA